MTLRFCLLKFFCFAGLFSCTHTVQVRTLPPQAEAFSIDDKGNRIESLGKTPLQTSNLSTSVRAIELELPGFLPSHVLIPQGPPKNMEFEVVLREFNKAALDLLSPKLYQGAVDKVMQQLLEYQQILFSGSAEEAQENIAKTQKNLDSIPSYHYITGSYFYFNGNFTEAIKSFSRAIALNPEHEQAKRMAILTDVKMANQTQAVRSKAFVTLQAAATEFATLSSGYLVRTKSKEWLTEFDGFEMILPSDSLFKPTTAKFLKEGQVILTKLAEELKKNESPRAITIEAHTDSDVSAELTKGNGTVLRGKPSFRSVWELSSARAAIVVDYLRNEGGVANTWNIAGYGDSRPLHIWSSSHSAKVADGALSRRIVIRVTNLPKETPLPTLTPEEVARLKARIQASQAEDENSSTEGEQKRNKKGVSESSLQAPKNSDRSDSKRSNPKTNSPPIGNSPDSGRIPRDLPKTLKGRPSSSGNSLGNRRDLPGGIPGASGSNPQATEDSAQKTDSGNTSAQSVETRRQGIGSIEKTTTQDSKDTLTPRQSPNPESPEKDFETFFEEPTTSKKAPPGKFRPTATGKNVPSPKTPKQKPNP